MAAQRDPGLVLFHPKSEEELLGTSSNLRQQLLQGSHQMQNCGLGPSFQNFQCGSCSKTTSGRVLCEVTRAFDQARILWCLCSCDKAEPTVIIEKESVTVGHFPIALIFRSEPVWPPDLAKLFDEASIAFSAGAYTASTMTCRKLLMCCACHEGAEEGKSFAEYVDFITDGVIGFPRAKTAIDAIRQIGNEANHQVDFVSEANARRALEIVKYMLATIHSLPSA